MTSLERKIVIAPSLLSSDFSRLAEEITAVEKAGADWIHVDVMDGHFVDNLTLGPPLISSIRKCTKLPFDVHLMIENPEKSAERYIKAGANYLTIHVEATKNPGELLRQIKSWGAKPGLTLRPETNINAIEKYLELCDLVLIMTVSPGWGGQPFMTEQVEKVRKIKAWAEKNNPKLWIEVDGGINAETAAVCREAGANAFVAGNFIFRSKDYAAAIKNLKP